MHPSRIIVVVAVLLVAGRARAQDVPDAGPEPSVAPTPAEPPPAPPAEPEPAPPSPPAAPEPELPPETFGFPAVAVHGFVSQGAFKSTGNDYLGHSKRGSLEFTEAAVNFSTEPVDRLRIGAQLFARDVGPVGDLKLGIDWAFVDYAYRPWLGLRAGRVKIPFGIYNEFSDVDSARLPILLPQGVYPIRSRDLLLAQTGFALYGTYDFESAGSLDYQAYFGSLFVDQRLAASGISEINGVDSRYIAGGQLLWRPPIEGLRLGGSVLFADVAFNLTLDEATKDALIASGQAPADFDGRFSVAFEPAALWLGSLEYVFDDWQLTAEYSRWVQEVNSSLQAVSPDRTIDSERFYGMASYHVTDAFEAGLYYAVTFANTDDRGGDGPQYVDADGRHRAAWAWHRDLALSLRYDVNDAWLWKLEGHFIDGLSELTRAENPDPERFWGLVLVKTTVSF